jgi:hypothetical protein
VVFARASKFAQIGYMATGVLPTVSRTAMRKALMSGLTLARQRDGDQKLDILPLTTFTGAINCVDQHLVLSRTL